MARSGNVSFGRRIHQRWVSMAAMLVVGALALASCAPDDVEPDEPEATDVDDTEVEEPEAPEEDEAPEEVDDGGTMVFAHEQEPGMLNPTNPGGGGGGAQATGGLIHAGPYVVNPDFEWVPHLLAEDAEISEDPFTVTYTIRDEARWSDGTDLTADDFVFTFETIMNPDWNIASTQGYNLISDYEVHDDKQVSFIFDEPYPSFRSLFPVIIPRHDAEGEDWDTYWEDGVPVSSGPFVFESWDRGQEMTFVRNENYWGDGPLLDRIVMRFVSETATLVELLRGGEIDATDPQPLAGFAEGIADLDNIVVDIKTGVITEHIRFNMDVAPLDQPYVRQAMMMSIDRAALVDNLMGAVDPDAEPPQSFTYAPGSPHYEEHFDQHAYDPEGAIALLEDNGCERDTDNVFICEGERLEFGYVTTSGNERRESMFEIVQAFTAETGFQLNADFSEAAVQFGERLPARDFDLMNHGTPMPDPVNMTPMFACDGPANHTGYCHEEMTELLNQADLTVDEDERAALINEVNRLIGEDLPLLPVMSLPRQVAYNADRVGGFDVAPGSDGMTSAWYWNWNAHEFYAVE